MRVGGKLVSLVVMALLLWQIPLLTSQAQDNSPDTSMIPDMQRCINMGNALEAPNYEGEWGVYVQDSYMQTIADAGFDTVRIPVRWSAYTHPEPPYTIETEFLERVDEVVQQALDAELNVIVNIHHYNEMNTQPDAELPRLFAIWEQLATHYQDYPSQLVFEVFNEPNNQLNAARWNELQPVLVDYIRTIEPDRAIIIGGAEWNSLSALEGMTVPDNTDNLIATIHNYEPFEFTHQGASWVDGSNAWLGRTWGTDTDYQILASYFARAVEWMETHNMPLFMGEFGVYSSVEMDQRTPWTAAVVEQAEANGISWCYWEFASGFGAYDPVLNRWRDPLLRALIPTSPTLDE
jgi:endoglucanase